MDIRQTRAVKTLGCVGVAGMKPRSRIRLEGCTMTMGNELGEKTLGKNKSPFYSIPLEVLGNIFLEYYYDEEVQQNCGYFIGANWKRWSRPGGFATDTNLGSPRGSGGDVDMDVEQQLGHPGAVLGSVCRTWRKVFLTTPRLWSSIRIWLNFPYHFYQSQKLSQSSLERRERDLNGIIREIELHLSRSRAAPLFIEIQTNCLNVSAGGGVDVGGEVFRNVLDVLGDSAGRVQELVVKRTDHPRRQAPRQRFHSFPPPSPVSAFGYPYPLSPQSPCGQPTPNSTDHVALSALEGFITKLDGLRNLTLDSWTQDAVLDLTSPNDETTALPALKNLTLLSSPPTFCCNGIPWSQITHFTSHNVKYGYGQLLDLLKAMPMLTHLDIKLSYNDTGVIPSPYPSPLPSPDPTLTGGFFTNGIERERPASPRRNTHIHLLSLTHLTLHGLTKSIQYLLCALKAPYLTTLRLGTFEAGIGVPQALPDQSPCESLFRFLRRSQCSLEWMRADTMFLVPPQLARSNNQDPNYLYSYLLKPTFVPLQSLKTLLIGRGPAEVGVKLLLALAWKGDPSSADLFPRLEEISCETKIGHLEADALCAAVMSRIPSRVVFVRRLSQTCQGLEAIIKEMGSPRLWPILSSNSNPSSSCVLQQLKRFPTRLRMLRVLSAKSDIYLKLRHHFRLWFPDFPQDPDVFLPQTFC